MKLNILRENIFRLLEEETKFNQGDTITTKKDGDGTVLLAKHPYYSIQLNNTGVTKSYHFVDLNASEPIENEFGKYELDEITINNPLNKINIINNKLSYNDINKLDLEDKLGITKIYKNHITLTPLYGEEGEYNLKFISNKLNKRGIKHNIINIINYGPGIKILSKYYNINNLNESLIDKIIKLDGILTVDEDVFLIDILSDIRSLTGITTVKNNINNEYVKTKLNIKIDPYPFKGQKEIKIQSFLIKQIKQIPGVRDFYKVKHVEKLPNNQKLRLPSSSPIPVSKMDEL